MKSVLETYKGKEIFYANYSNLSLEQIREEVGAIEKELVHAKENSILLLVNSSGTIISPEVLKLFKNLSLNSKKYIRKSAILGITGARRLLWKS